MKLQQREVDRRRSKANVGGLLKDITGGPPKRAGRFVARGRMQHNHHRKNKKNDIRSKEVIISPYPLSIAKVSPYFRVKREKVIPILSTLGMERGESIGRHQVGCRYYGTDCYGIRTPSDPVLSSQRRTRPRQGCFVATAWCRKRRRRRGQPLGSTTSRGVYHGTCRSWQDDPDGFVYGNAVYN